MAELKKKMELKKKKKKPTTTPANMWQATEKDVECILQIKNKNYSDEYYLHICICGVCVSEGISYKITQILRYSLM